jgi:NADH:ubiquinone reductase (H+-translocating)
MEVLTEMRHADAAHRVVIVGGGFGGLQAARGLRRARVEVTLVDRRNFHLFQPLLYQVATGALSPGEIASPLRGILKRQRNAHVVLGEVTSFDLERRQVAVDLANHETATLGYETLVVAAGASHAYFGHEEWQEHAPGLKTVEDAVKIRQRILTAFEAAEVEHDPDRRRAWLTFVVVGGGPTGVELAGQIGEIARDTLPSNFRASDPRGARIVLVEANARLLTTFSKTLSTKAARGLERLGVTPALGRTVVALDATSVTLQAADGATSRIPTRTVIWAAGVQASPLAAGLAGATGAELDRAGRVSVGPNLTLKGHPEVIVIGDMARVHDAKGHELSLPGVAPTAMQQGSYVARLIERRLAGAPEEPFGYVDKGSLATIGRRKAVAEIKGIELSGTPAWLIWLLLHIFYLDGLQNRVIVFIRWTVSFATHGRGARLITGKTRDGLDS